MSIIKNTDFKNPKTVTQYAKYNGNTCSAWSRLEKVKEDELDDLSAVCYNLTNKKRSALMYCYNFGFNIPTKATITKVLVQTVVCQDDIAKSHVQTQILKLKIGANTTDSGVGNNLAPKTAWRTHKEASKKSVGMEYTIIGNSTSSVKSVWGVEITPATVNNSNFGVVFQCMGDGTQKHKAYVDNIQVAIEYSLPDETPIIQNVPTTTTTDTGNPIEASLSTSKYDVLNPSKHFDETVTSQPYDSTAGYHFWIKYTNNAELKNGTQVILNKNSDPVLLETDGKTIFSGGTTQITVPSIVVKGTSDSRYFVSEAFPSAPNCIEQFYDVYVFSNVVDFAKYDTNNQGVVESIVKLYSTKTVNGKIIKDTLITSLTFNLNSSTSNIANSQTIIENCTFVDNHANKGAAIYNLGRLYVKNLVFDDNHTHGEGRNNCQFYDVDICRDREFD